jgi:hypothetical protein
VVDDLAESSGVDLLDVGDDDNRLLREILGNERKLIKIAYAIAKLNGLEIDEKDFKKGIDGDIKKVIADTLVESLANFSQPEKRAVILEGMARRKELEAMAVEQAVASIRKLDVSSVANKMEAKMDDLLQKGLQELDSVLSSTSTPGG